MRFPSGVTDQYIYFVAVDSTDYVTRETGLSSFTVYRARNGAAAAAYTTPTVAEVSSGNMPGVYSLLLDEDMTIGSGNDSEEVVLHITQASMAPVTIKYELYREKITQGETLTVSSGTGNAAVQSMANNVLTAAAINADAITAAKVASDVGTEIGTAVWAAAARTLTALDEDNTTMDLDATIRAAVGLASANLDTQIGTLATAANLATVDTVVDAILVDTAEIGAAGAGLTAVPWNAAWDAEVQSEVTDALNAYDPPTTAELVSEINAVQADIAALTIPSAASVADAVWEEPIADHSGTAGSTAEQLAAAGSAGDPWATALPGAYSAGQAGKIVGDNLNATVSSRATQTSVDDLPTNAELATALAGADDAVLAAIGALTIPSAADNAAAVLAAAFENAETVQDFLRLSRAALYGKAGGLETTTAVFRDAADTKARITATVDASGNRTAVTIDAA